MRIDFVERKTRKSTVIKFREFLGENDVERKIVDFTKFISNNLFIDLRECEDITFIAMGIGPFSFRLDVNMIK